MIMWLAFLSASAKAAVIASEAKQSRLQQQGEELDFFVASAPRNDVPGNSSARRKLIAARGNCQSHVRYDRSA
jgi:hypothetical protein